jgi:hypothetical protein
MFQKTGHNNADWDKKQLAVNEQTYPKFIKHKPKYPSYEKLKSILFI